VHRDFDVLRKIVTALISIALPSTGCLLGLGHQVTVKLQSICLWYLV